MAEAGGQQGDTGGVSLGKGAWDCDNNCEIPPEKEVSAVKWHFGCTGASAHWRSTLDTLSAGSGTHLTQTQPPMALLWHQTG